MFEYFADLCGSTPDVLAKNLMIGSNLMIAAAYLSIPVIMLWVFRHRKEDIPHPMLWILFATFITSCGFGHLLHFWNLVTPIPNALAYQGIVDLITGIISVGTTIAFIYVIPQIAKMPSPSKTRKDLHDQVAKATEQKDELIHQKEALLMELNHRVGNQLAKMAAVTRREIRISVENGDSIESLKTIEDFLEELGAEHRHLSSMDYASNFKAQHLAVKVVP